MGQDPDAIQQDIAQTRTEMSETVEAIGYKANVASRPGRGEPEGGSREVQGDGHRNPGQGGRDRHNLPGRGRGKRDRGPGGRGHRPTGGEAKQQAKRAVGLAKENPLGLAVGAVALGFLAGLVVPSTRVENERLGPVADQVKDKVNETGQEALDRGKQVAQEAASSAADTARRQGREHRPRPRRERQAERPGRPRPGNPNHHRVIDAA